MTSRATASMRRRPARANDTDKFYQDFTKGSSTFVAKDEPVVRVCGEKSERETQYSKCD